VYGYGPGAAGPGHRYPEDIRRLRRQYFSSADQLLTLALAGGFDPAHWALAREVGAPISVHVNGAGQLSPLAAGGHMRSDVTYIHCCNLTEEEWKRIADTGGGVSIAGPIEMEMGHGVPPYQQAIDHGVPLSFSNDVETEIPSEFFTQMRTAFTLQRMLAFSRERAGDRDTPKLMTVKEVVEAATLGGAKVNHLDRKVGSLTPGKDADILLLAANLINVLPLNHAYGAIVLAMDTANVDTVMIAGKVKKWKGQLVGLDPGRLRTMVEQSRAYVLSKAGWRDTVLGGYLPGH
jgi:cytosine/adenosine deaminase-related metal-dependent hydrolase